jgi:hypothetical protein
LRELSQARLLSESVLARERDRLSPASWLIEEVSRVGSCPFCGSENHSGTIELERLRQRAAAVESQWQGIAAVPAMLDAEEVELRRARDQEEERLYQIRAERASVEQLTSVARKADEERALFIGKLVEFLAAQGSLSSDSDRMKEIEELEAEEQRLQAQVDTDVIAQRKEDALLIISRYAQHYGRLVELENNDAVIKLDTRELSIRVLNDRGESAWLYQIGSGANHLGYHVATMLALHEFFIRRPIYYVPSLLIVDQPSQTQFADESAEEDEQEELLAVHKAFEAFDSAIDRTNGMLQVIVSEHAGKTVYAGIRHLTVVERWRRGRKLIPWHWMDEQAMGELDGKRADWAFEDLLEKIIRPAFVSALELSEALEILELNIESAIFENLGIAFEVRVAVNRKQAFGTQMEGRSREAVIKGSIRQDLSVSIDEVQNFS